jgi:hypothetical protein
VLHSRRISSLKAVHTMQNFQFTQDQEIRYISIHFPTFDESSFGLEWKQTITVSDRTLLLAYFPYFEKIKVGLCDHHAVCVYLLLSTSERLN